MGNFQLLDFPMSDGGESYAYYVKYGYDGPVPDPVDADHPWMLDVGAGDFTGPTQEAVNDLISQDPGGTCNSSMACPRVVRVVLLQETWDQARGVTTVHAIGFAAFFIDMMEEDSGTGTVTIWGHFIAEPSA